MRISTILYSYQCLKREFTVDGAGKAGACRLRPRDGGGRQKDLCEEHTLVGTDGKHSQYTEKLSERSCLRPGEPGVANGASNLQK
jgi:hypothetical protein